MKLLYSKDGFTWRLLRTLWPFDGGYSTTAPLELAPDGSVVKYGTFFEGGGLFSGRQALLFNNFTVPTGGYKSDDGAASKQAIHATALDRLPAGAILPTGWLKAQAGLQANGMTLGLGFWASGGIADDYCVDPSLNGTVIMKPGKGQQGGEYDLNGTIPLSCQVDQPLLRRLREASIVKILNTTHSGGYLGPPVPANGTKSSGDSYWRKMILVLALESYVECEGPFAPSKTMQAKVETALVKHYIAMYKMVVAKQPDITKDYWGSARYSEFCSACSG